ncbi:Protein of unknown function [Cotesia congregata]|uniref:Endonuclease/exonuclease/phosphatase domain-containing protein n=1 Tax=Cotesia congregata TaxID=51543 RepID=A0A8J2HJP3_COTCN|nr:Protein of unknown function [Cotesia congregata]
MKNRITPPEDWPIHAVQILRYCEHVTTTKANPDISANSSEELLSRKTPVTKTNIVVDSLSYLSNTSKDSYSSDLNSPSLNKKFKDTETTPVSSRKRGRPPSSFSTNKLRVQSYNPITSYLQTDSRVQETNITSIISTVSPPNKILKTTTSPIPTLETSFSLTSIPQAASTLSEKMSLPAVNSLAEVLAVLDGWRKEDNKARDVMRKELLDEITSSREEHNRILTEKTDKLQDENSALKDQIINLNERITRLEQAKISTFTDPHFANNLSAFEKHIVKTSISAMEKHIRRNIIVVRGLNVTDSSAVNSLNQFIKDHFNIDDAVQEVFWIIVPITNGQTSSMQITENSQTDDLSSNPNTINDNQLLCISETWETLLNPILPSYFNKWHHCISPAVKINLLGRGSGGLLSLSNESNPTKTLSTSENWIFHSTVIHETNIIIGSVYFQPNLKNLYSILDSLQIILDKILAEEEYNCFIIGGDFNARVESFLYEDPTMLKPSCLYSMRSACDKETNHQGSILYEFMSSNGFILLNGRTPGDYNEDFTFSNARGNSTVDLVWVNTMDINLVKGLAISNALTKSDHFPVVVTLHSIQPIPSAQLSNVMCSVSPSFSLRWCSSSAHSFKNSMFVSPLIAQNFATATTNDLNHAFQNAITNADRDAAMLKLLHSQPKSRNRFISKSWYVTGYL